MTNTQKLLLVLAAITLLLTIFGLDEAEDELLPTAYDSRTPSDLKKTNNSREIAKIVDLSLTKKQLVPLVGDLFAVEKPKFVHKPNVLKMPAIAQKNIAIVETLPFKYLGRMQGPGENSVLAEYGDDIILLKEGDLIASQYQVKSIDQKKEMVNVTFINMKTNQIQMMQVRVGQP
jgi:hypothetical protein